MDLSAVNPRYLEEEEIIPKLQYVELLEQISPYPSVTGKYSERVSRALEFIPDQYQRAALAVFANVIYLPRALLDRAWTYLLDEVARNFGLSREEFINNARLFEVDFEGALYSFMRHNKIEGRLDISRYPRSETVDKLLEKLHWFAFCPEGVANQALKTEVEVTFNKKYWVIISGSSLSGTSLSSDLARALELVDLLREKYSPPLIIPLIQVMTESAKREILSKFDTMLGSRIIPPFYAIFLDSTFRVHPENESNCRLFSNPVIFSEVIELCEWFATKTFFSSDPRLEETKKKSGDDLRYGFKAGGWTIVLPNCPENSLPILWYSIPGNYQAPFPRVRSRIEQARGMGREILGELLQIKDHLIRKLSE